MSWTLGDHSGSETLTDDDNLYAGHINELRQDLSSFTPYIRSLLDDPAAAEARSTLGVNGKSQIVVGAAGDLGYVTDGTADDVQIQAAVDYLTGNGGGIVRLRGASFYTSSAVTLKSNVTIVGDGMAVTTVYSSVSTGTWAFLAPGSGQTKNLRQNIWLKDFTIANMTASHSALISNTRNAGFVRVEAYHTVWDVAIRESLMLQHCEGAYYLDCFIHDTTGNGVQVNGCDYFYVGGNRIVNFYNNVAQAGIYHMDDGIDIDEDFLDTSAVPSRFGFVERNVIQGISAGNNTRIASSQYVFYRNNQSYDCALGSSAGASILVNSYSGTHPDTHHIWVENNLVLNLAVGAVSNGIAIIKDTSVLTNVYVRRNTVKGAGNTAGGQLGAGILIGADGAIVTDNEIDACGKTGGDGGALLWYRSGNNAIARRNSISNSPGAAVRFWNGNGTTTYTGVTLTDTELSSNTLNYANTGASVVTFATVKRNDSLNPELSYAIGNSGASKTINRSDGERQSMTLTASCTLTIPAGLPGDDLYLDFTEDGTGGWALTKPSNVKLVGGAWSNTTTAAASSSYHLKSDGTNWVEISRALNVS